MANLRDYKSYLTKLITPSTLSTASLWAHQEAMLTFASSQPYALLYAGMSTGKTLVALRYLEQFKGLRLILSPAKPMNVYKEDLGKFYPKGAPFKLYILDKGTALEKTNLVRSILHENAIVVISYNTAVTMPLDEFNFSAAVCDEVHHIGIHNSIWSMALAKLCKDIPRKMAMSGTVFHDARERLYGVYRWFDPIIYTGVRTHPQARLFGHYNSFLDNYCNTFNKGNIRIIKSYKNTEELLRLIRPTCLQVKTEDVIDLPKLVIRNYPVALAKATRKAYDSLRYEAIITFDDSAILAPHIMTRILRLQQLVASGELVDDTGAVKTFNIDSRVEQLKYLLEELGSEPVVIFTRFKKDVQLISSLVEDYSLLTGGTDTLDEWLRGDTQYLIANVASGSEGVRLIRAHHIIVWSLSYSLKEYVQLIARIRRYGQERGTVFIHVITAENTVDGDILDAIQRKALDVDELDKGLKVGDVVGYDKVKELMG